MRFVLEKGPLILLGIKGAVFNSTSPKTEALERRLCAIGTMSMKR